jgi:hypothetical protein
MGFHVAVLLALLVHDAGTAAPEPRVELWAGHQVLVGKRKIPLYGQQETHTENYLLAEVRRTASRIEIRQKVCRIDIRPIKGTLATMKPETVAHMPRSHVVFDEAPDGKLTAAPWSHGWSADDIDADGFPGATVHINGTCSGDVYISSESQTTLLSGHATADGASGEESVHLTQKVLGASGLCLKLVAGDSDEIQNGWFDYRRVPLGSTCQSLAEGGKPWPAKARQPPAAAKPTSAP